MTKKTKIAFILVIAAILIVPPVYILHHDVAVLNPGGPIAEKQRNLFWFAGGMSLIVIVPVLFMTFYFAWKYREDNKSAKYSPNWDSSKLFESIWWGIPSILIIILAVITYNSSHSLDPFKPLASDKRPLKVQVVALDWKWLFIYPEQNIATVNYAEVPTNRPINFEITSDAPMNSFWVPKLGGQIYAMSGMITQLHLEADRPGIYHGSSANISGRGFSDMDFDVKASSDTEFSNWVNEVKKSVKPLYSPQYQKLQKPSENNRITYFSGVQNYLFENTVLKFNRFDYSSARLENNGSSL